MRKKIKIYVEYITYKIRKNLRKSFFNLTPSSLHLPKNFIPQQPKT